MVTELEEIARNKAAQRLKAEIDALFASARDVEQHERSAVMFWRPATEDGVWQWAAFQVFANGIIKAEGQPPPALKSLDEAVARTVERVKREYPDHSNMDLIWRTPPTCDENDGLEFSYDPRKQKVSDIKATDLAYWYMRARILALPHGAICATADELRALDNA